MSVYVPTNREGQSRRDENGNEVRYKFDRDLEKARDYLVNAAVTRMFKTEDPRNAFLTIKFKDPKIPPRIFRYSDFTSGARIKNIIDRAKFFGLMRYVLSNKKEHFGVMLLDLYTAIENSFSELKNPSARQELHNWLATEGRMQNLNVGEIESIEVISGNAILGEDSD